MVKLSSTVYPQVHNAWVTSTDANMSPTGSLNLRNIGSNFENVASGLTYEPAPENTSGLTM